jgi:hypothetical protein
LGQALTNDRAQCQYTDAAIGIGIVFLAIGAILGIGGAKSKKREEVYGSRQSHASYRRENRREDMEGLCLVSKLGCCVNK